MAAAAVPGLCGSGAEPARPDLYHFGCRCQEVFVDFHALVLDGGSELAPRRGRVFCVKGRQGFQRAQDVWGLRAGVQYLRAPKKRTADHPRLLLTSTIADLQLRSCDRSSLTQRNQPIVLITPSPFSACAAIQVPAQSFLSSPSCLGYGMQIWCRHTRHNAICLQS